MYAATSLPAPAAVTSTSRPRCPSTTSGRPAGRYASCCSGSPPALATAEAAIDLFLEYRDCHGYQDEDQAAAKALIDVREGVAAIHELAGYDSDPGWRP